MTGTTGGTAQEASIPTFKRKGHPNDIELVVELQQGQEVEYKRLIEDGLQAVNDQLKLNRDLACDVKFGGRYSDIH